MDCTECINEFRCDWDQDSCPLEARRGARREAGSRVGGVHPSPVRMGKLSFTEVKF